MNSLIISVVLLALSVCLPDQSAAVLDACTDIPSSYREKKFGEVLYSIEKPCGRNLSHEEQLFVAGLSDYLSHKCNYPATNTLRQFIGTMGSLMMNPGEHYRTERTNEVREVYKAAWKAGQFEAERMGCSPSSRSAVMNVVAYVDRRDSHSTPAEVQPMPKEDICGEIPTDYREKAFGEVLYSLEKQCTRVLSYNEQMFAAGFSSDLPVKCNYSSDPQSRLALRIFAVSSEYAASIPNKKSRISDATSAIGAFKTGKQTAAHLGCSPLSENIINGVVRYLKITSENSKWIKGCAEYYHGQYSMTQCQCFATFGRSMYPNIYQEEFTTSRIRSITTNNPFITMQLGSICGLRNY